GLCSNKPHEFTLETLAQLDLASYFEVVLGEQEGRPRKPDPEPLRRVLHDLGEKHEDAVFIGDSIADVACAKAAGVRSIVVSFGYSRVPVADLGADHMVDHLSEIPGVLGIDL